VFITWVRVNTCTFDASLDQMSNGQVLSPPPLSALRFDNLPCRFVDIHDCSICTVLTKGRNTFASLCDKKNRCGSTRDDKFQMQRRGRRRLLLFLILLVLIEVAWLLNSARDVQAFRATQKHLEAMASPAEESIVKRDRQSPIDIDTNRAQKAKDRKKLKLVLIPGAVEIENNGYTIQVTPREQKVKAFFDGVGFSLKQFHFHHPAEHRFDSSIAMLELHLVFVDPKGNKVIVIGVVFKLGKENPFLESIFSWKLPKQGDESRPGTMDISLLDLQGSYFNYPGSLTTPPYSEIVNWFVSTTVQEMSEDQLQAFTNAVSFENNRECQNIHNREVVIREVAMLYGGSDNCCSVS